jgi:ubiquitin-conjugating enzyme E2 A
MLEPWF